MTGQRESLRVFISYARADASGFAEELLAGLEVAGFEAFLDRHDIAGGEDWEARLGGLIQSADTVVFVLTPASVASERCQWEVTRSLSQSKRIIPIVAIDVTEAQTPADLKRLNYIFFTPGHSFSRSLGELATALRVDVEWIREHTRLGEVARRWHEKDRSEVILLRGAELEAARLWLSAWRSPAPEPTELQRAFIAASETAESAVVKRERARARRTALVSLAAVVIFGVLGALAICLAAWAYQGQRTANVLRSEAAELAAQAQDAESRARNVAATASLYEGLYWLRAGNSGGGSVGDWQKALLAFNRGREALGSDDAEVEGHSLRGLLGYGQRFVRLCVGLASDDTEVAPPDVREFYLTIHVPDCPSQVGRPRPARPRPMAP